MTACGFQNLQNNPTTEVERMAEETTAMETLAAEDAQETIGKDVTEGGVQAGAEPVNYGEMTDLTIHKEEIVLTEEVG